MKFEYRVVYLQINKSSTSTMERTLNIHGLNRWELVAINSQPGNMMCVFKRELREPDAVG